MTDEEVDAFLHERQTMNIATFGPDGNIHLVAMWYGFIDGKPAFETFTKSQKIKNLQRDNRITVLVEDGETYDSLRGVAIEGTAEIVDDADALWAVGVQVWERYNGPYSEEVKPLVEFMLNNRVAVRVRAQRTRSWDHRKLGMDALPIGGTTAEHLHDRG